MLRTYELALVLDPRESDEDVQVLIEQYRKMIEDSGATVDLVDNWGKRKLAYDIQDFKDGKYVFLFVSSKEGDVQIPWVDIERLLMQNEKVLRHLIVRTDEDLKRAARAKTKPEHPHLHLFEVAE